MKTLKVTFITEAAVIAALYTALVLAFSYSSFGPIQFRVAEALTVLPYFTPAAIPGLTIGCFLSAVLTGADILDIVFGSLATLIGALISYQLRKYKFLVPIPPILANAIIIPWVLRFAYGEAQPIYLMMISVGAGELLAVGVLGTLLLLTLGRVRHIIFHVHIYKNTEK